MTKILSAWKLELKLLYRNVFTWIVLLLSLVYIGKCFYSHIINYLDPGSSMTTSAYVIQGGLFFSMVLGFFIVNREYSSSSDDMFYCIYNGYLSKMLGKFLALVAAMFTFLLISLSIQFYFFYTIGVALIFYWHSFLYILLYWIWSFVIAGLIGMILGIFIKSRLVYIFLVSIWGLIGPLNLFVFERLSTITHIDFRAISDFLNLGQSDPTAPYNVVYGLPLEIHRWIHKGLIFTIVIFIFLMIIIKNNCVKIKHFLASAVPCIFLILILCFQVNQPNQLIRTGVQKDSVDYYDLKYYEENNKPNFSNIQSFTIESYSIDIKSFRNLKVKAALGIRTSSEISELVFTLYHGLHIKNVVWKGESQRFEQRGDQFLVTLSEQIKSNEKILLSITYEGNSSQHFFANDQALMLPSFFPWLPVEGSYQAMKIEGNNLVFCPLFPRHSIFYSVRYSGPKPLYINIPHKGANFWEGTAQNGITLVAGMMTETKIGDISVYYPLTLNKIIPKIPNYISRTKELYKILESDLSVKIPEINNMFFISLPQQISMTPSYTWSMKNNYLVAVSNDYCTGELMDYTPSIGNILASEMQNREMFEQPEDIKTAFIFSYISWLESRNSKSPHISYDIENYLKNAKNLLGSKDIDKLNLDKTELKKKIQTSESILKLIKKNNHNQPKVKEFFKAWFGKMSQPNTITWDDILKLSKGDTDNE